MNMCLLFEKIHVPILNGCTYNLQSLEGLHPFSPPIGLNPNRDFQVPKLLYRFTLAQEMASDHCAVLRADGFCRGSRSPGEPASNPMTGPRLRQSFPKVGWVQSDQKFMKNKVPKMGTL